MRSVVLVPMLVAACTDKAACELETLGPTAAYRRGIAAGSILGLRREADGSLSCEICRELTFLDQDLNVLSTGGTRADDTGDPYITPDGRGGYYQRSVPVYDMPGTTVATATIAHHDASGAVTWTKTLTARSEPQAYETFVRITGVAARGDGSIVIAGTFTATLELDAFTLQRPTMPGTGFPYGANVFVAAIDLDGTTTWARAHGAHTASSMMLAALGDDAAIATSTLDGAELVRIGATGDPRAVSFDGEGGQSIAALIAADDGALIVAVRSFSDGLDDLTDSQLEINGADVPYDEGGGTHYIFKMQL